MLVNLTRGEKGRAKEKNNRWCIRRRGIRWTRKKQGRETGITENRSDTARGKHVGEIRTVDNKEDNEARDLKKKRGADVKSMMVIILIKMLHQVTHQSSIAKCEEKR